MSSLPDPIEEGLKALIPWEDDASAPSPIRRVFFVRGCFSFVDSTRFYDRTPKKYSKSLGESKTAGEQLELLLAKYVRGSPLCVEDVTWIHSALPPCVWELRTSDVRLFGVFVKKDCFVACVAGLADNIHNPDHPDTTERFARAALEEIQKLPDALRKPLEGGNPNAIVSLYQ